MAYTQEQQEILDEYNLKDLRHFKTDYYIQKVNEFKGKDTEYQLKLLEAMPDQLQFLAGSIGVCKNALDLIIETDKSENVMVFENYSKVLDDISDCLDNPDLTEQQRLDYINKEIEIADKIADYSKNKQWFRVAMLSILTTTVGSLGGVALKSYLDKHPTLPKK